MRARVAAAGIVMCDTQTVQGDLYRGPGPGPLGLLWIMDSLSLAEQGVSIERSIERLGEEQRNEDMAD